MKLTRFSAGLVAALVLGACASTPETDPVQIQLGAHERELQTLRAEIADLRARLEGIGAAGLGSTVGGMEEDLRNLRGEVESLRYALEGQQQRRRAATASRPTPSVPGRDETVPPPPSVGGQPTATSSVDQDDQAAYLEAFGKLKSGDYSAAVTAFEGFLSVHPSSAYAPNAQYWIGEAWYVQRSFDQAWMAFNQVLERYPNSLKAADARLKQGLIRVDQGRMSDARAILQEVATRHAGSSAGRLAAERLQRMGGG